MLDRTESPHVRFYGSLAVEYGVRFSALVAHVYGWTQNKRKASERDPDTYDQVAKFARALGISERQFYRLRDQAVTEGYLWCRARRNFISLGLTKSGFLEKDTRDFFYDRDLAVKCGNINGSILLSNIHLYPRGFKSSYHQFALRYPWMTREGVRQDLLSLKKKGYVDWDSQDCWPGTDNHRFFTRMPRPKQGEPVVKSLRRFFKLQPAKILREEAEWMLNGLDNDRTPHYDEPKPRKPRPKLKRQPSDADDDEVARMYTGGEHVSWSG